MHLYRSITACNNGMDRDEKAKEKQCTRFCGRDLGGCEAILTAGGESVIWPGIFPTKTAIIGYQAYQQWISLPRDTPAPGLRLQSQGDGNGASRRSQVRWIFGVIIFRSCLSFVARAFFFLHDIP